MTARYLTAFAILLVLGALSLRADTTGSPRSTTIALPADQRLVVGSIRVLDHDTITYVTKPRKSFDVGEPETYTVVIASVFTPATNRSTIIIKESGQ